MQTTLCYIERDEAYLMLHRVSKESDPNRDKWIGVGGKFEKNESPEECMLREVFEETGLTLDSYQYRGIVTFVSNEWEETEYMHVFTSSKFHGDIKECDEGKLEWVDKNDLFHLPMWEGDVYFLQEIMEDTPFFSIKLVYEGNTLQQVTINGKRVK